MSWGDLTETVAGSAGHVDRQWFPKVANDGGPTGDIRSRAHEWRTINLDNGVDISVWRQFDRTNRNAIQPFSGATTSSPESDPEYADDIEVTVTSYVRWPESIRTLVPPPAAARYMPDRHRLTSRELGLDLTGEPLVPAPAHGLPLEYMEGPYRYHGTCAGSRSAGSRSMNGRLRCIGTGNSPTYSTQPGRGSGTKWRAPSPNSAADSLGPRLVTMLQAGLVAAEHQMVAHAGREVEL